MDINSHIKHLIFDLDGTLIDSSSSILSAMANTLSANGIDPKMKLDSSIIGPPLSETMSLLAGTDDVVLLDGLCSTFKSFYDTEGYKATTVFPGVNELLAVLSAKNIPLFIATNKRQHPTRLIIEHLGWNSFFRNVYALDCMSPVVSSKAALLEYLLNAERIDPLQSLYVGDKPEDGHAAEQNNLHFFAACWGYGALTPTELRPGWRLFYSPDELLTGINNWILADSSSSRGKLL